MMPRGLGTGRQREEGVSVFGGSSEEQQLKKEKSACPRECTIWRRSDQPGKGETHMSPMMEKKQRTGEGRRGGAHRAALLMWACIPGQS